MKTTVSIAALCAIATAAVLGFGATPSDATVSCDRYAATSGSDSAAGTSAAPFRTAQKLADSLSAGQTGCLSAGVYKEDLRLNHGGAPGSPIRLTSAPGSRATLVGRLYVPDTSNDAVFADLNLDGTNSGNLSSPMVAGDRITFTGNDVTDKHTSICFGLGSDSGWGTAVDVVIDNNRIHDCGRLPATNHDHGIYVESTRNAVITNNYIYDNADRGIQLYPDAQGTKIANNVIDGNGEGVLFSGDSGLASSNNVVTRNIVSNAVVRYNVESWWPDGNPVGTGNSATDNCVWNGAQGNVAAQVGFTASANKAVNPLYANRAAKDFQLQSGSPCAGYGPDVTTTPAANPPPPPPPPAPATVSPPANTTGADGLRHSPIGRAAHRLERGLERHTYLHLRVAALRPQRRRLRGYLDDRPRPHADQRRRGLHLARRRSGAELGGQRFRHQRPERGRPGEEGTQGRGEDIQGLPPAKPSGATPSRAHCPPLSGFQSGFSRHPGPRAARASSTLGREHSRTLPAHPISRTHD